MYLLPLYTTRKLVADPGIMNGFHRYYVLERRACKCFNKIEVSCVVIEISAMVNQSKKARILSFQNKIHMYFYQSNETKCYHTLLVET